MKGIKEIPVELIQEKKALFTYSDYIPYLMVGFLIDTK